MPVTTNKQLDIKSYTIKYNFVQSQSGSSDRLACISLYGPTFSTSPLAELSFYPGFTGFSVSEQTAGSGGGYDHVQILMSTDYFDGICSLLRNERPLCISFHRNDAGVLNNVWFGTSSREPTSEEEARGIRLSIP